MKGRPNSYKTVQYGFVILVAILAIPFIGLSFIKGLDSVLVDLPDDAKLFQPGMPFTNKSMSVHMILGAMVTFWAPIQLLSGWSGKYLRWHRLLGYIFSILVVITSLAGLGFIIIRGTSGGSVMDAGFGLYGVLMLLAVVETVRSVRKKELPRHRRWALRLAVLATASWFYRIIYGYWFWLHEMGVLHLQTYENAFHDFMNFGFYLPALLLLEIYFYSQRSGRLQLNPILMYLLFGLMGSVTIIGFLRMYGRYFT